MKNHFFAFCATSALLFAVHVAAQSVAANHQNPSEYVINLQIPGFPPNAPMTGTTFAYNHTRPLPEDCACSDGMCPMQTSGGQWVILNRQGKQAFPFILEATSCPRFSDGIAVFEQHGQLMFIDKQGQQILTHANVTWAAPFHDGLALASVPSTGARSERLVLLDHQGHVTPLPEEVQGCWGHDNSFAFHEGLAGCNIDQKAIYINTGGKVVIRHPAASIQQFSDGLAWIDVPTISNGIQWGAIDKTGKVVIPFMYSIEPDPFQDGLAAVRARQNMDIGFIDKTNTIRIPPQNIYIKSPFKNGHAIVDKDNKNLLIDKSGNVLHQIDMRNPGSNITSPGSEFVCSPQRKDGLCVFHVFGGAGIADREGNVLIPAKYFAAIGDFADGTEGLAWAKAYTKRGTDNYIEGYINIRGEFVVVQRESQF
jgi:hypothetical protein